jgi:ribosomal protein S6--L-glutamate ligase
LVGEFRNNVSQGGQVSFENIPEEALDFARDVARRCRFDDVGLDVCQARGTWYVLEANMVFGMEGFRLAGLDYRGELARMDREGVF